MATANSGFNVTRKKTQENSFSEAFFYETFTFSLCLSRVKRQIWPGENCPFFQINGTVFLGRGRACKIYSY